VYVYAPTGNNFTMLSGPSGDLLIGDYNSSLGNNTIYWVSSPLNVNETNAWYTTLTEFTINTTSYINATFTSPVRFMTGVAGIGLNSTWFALVCSQIQAMHPNLTIYCTNLTENGGYPYSDSACPAESWNATFSFGTDQSFILSSNSFMREMWDDEVIPPNATCGWLIGDIGASANVVIGSVFIEQFVTVFDAENSQVGFAISPLVPHPDGLGPWITTKINGGSTSTLAVVLIVTGSLAVVAVVGVVVLTQIRKKKQQNNADSIAYSSMK
jgi:hypothetical protein